MRECNVPDVSLYDATNFNSNQNIGLLPKLLHEIEQNGGHWAINAPQQLAMWKCPFKLKTQPNSLREAMFATFAPVHACMHAAGACMHARTHLPHARTHTPAACTHAHTCCMHAHTCCMHAHYPPPPHHTKRNNFRTSSCCVNPIACLGCFVRKFGPNREWSNAMSNGGPWCRGQTYRPNLHCLIRTNFLFQIRK